MGYHADYKYLWSQLKLSNHASRVKLIKGSSNSIDNKVNQHLKGIAIDKTGSNNLLPFTRKELIFEEIKSTERSIINFDDVDELVFSLKAIDRLANRKKLKHVFLIPPVYESKSKKRLNTLPNRVLSKAIDEFRKTNTNTIIIDHRFISDLLGKDKSDYFIHYDHPSPKYGKYLYSELKSRTKL